MSDLEDSPEKAVGRTVKMKTVKPTIPGLVTVIDEEGKARSLAARFAPDGANLKLWEVEGFVYQGDATRGFELTHAYIATRDQGIRLAFLGIRSVHPAKGDSIVVAP